MTSIAANVKALIVVLGIGAIVLYLAKPIALRFSSVADFRRRNAIWFALTCAGFLCSNFWWFVLIAAPLLFWGGRKDSHPVAFYLFLMLVVPSIFVDIPTLAVNRLFALDIYRLMSICVLIPAAWRWRRSTEPTAVRRIELPEVLLLAFGALQVIFYVRPDLASNTDVQDSFTNALRRAFLYFIDVYIVYFAVRRYCSSRRALVEAMAALCLCCAITAPVAVFESLRHWLLYGAITANWSVDVSAQMYLLRDHMLRAEAAAGDPLALGYILAIACGLWLYLWRESGTTARKSIAVLSLWLGLFAAYSRGPWIGAVAIYLSFAVFTPQRVSNLFKTGGALIVIAAALFMSPLGDKIIEILPFFGGSVDSSSYLYRQQLAANSWQLIQQHPLLGDRFAYSHLGGLRQGEGIIDLVNTYLEVALFYGLIGLALFAGFIVVALLRAYRLMQQCARSDPDLALLGAALVACIVGTLLMLADCSFIFAYANLYYVLGGLATGYASLRTVPQLAPAQPHATEPMPTSDPRIYPLRDPLRGARRS